MSSPSIKKAFVTGGAGFIGSHIVDHLLSETDAEVVVYDNLSTGRRDFLSQHSSNPRFHLVLADVLDYSTLHGAMAGADIVFHLQANADVRGGIKNRRVDLEQNTVGTWNVLESMHAHGVKRIAFASSATVYGEPEKFPTPEDTAPLQTSLYGASKYACEGMIQAYGEYFDITSYIFRFVSWTGKRYTHGVVYDFFQKLQRDPSNLEILGNGKQQKSYLDVTDGVAGIFHAIAHAKDKKNVFNLGHDDFINVLEVADILCEELGLSGVSYNIEDPNKERGWIGDSPFVHLDTTKLKALGWSPKVSIEQSIRETCAYLRDHPALAASRAA
jgi:UDP-glucose 4-epimerase